MDDFSTSTLHESKNEWCARLLTILTPLIIEGFNSIFNESLKMCKDNDEEEKYLMTFQNLITRIPKWNNTIVETEKERIIERSKCAYLEDLLSCVHVIQVKILTVMRVGQKQKKIDIDIPKLNDFLHKCYINSARQVYKNVYLFEKNLLPLQIQKHNRELQQIIQESILVTIRESIPIENILKAYMDESIEEDIQEEIKEEIISREPIKNQEIVNEEPKILGETKEEIEEETTQSIDIKDETDNRIQFNNIDYTIDTNNVENEVSNTINGIQLTDEDVTLDTLDIHDLNEKEEIIETLPELLLDNVEILD